MAKGFNRPVANDFSSAWTLLALIALSALAIGWRLIAIQYDFFHPDEVIATSVVDRVINEPTLDTNWARTRLPEEFRRNQYNFSAYHLFAAASEAVADSVGMASSALLVRLRQNNAVLGGLVVFLAGWLALRLGGSGAALVAALLVAVCVTLFQDSLYARPEAFASILVLTVLLLGSGTGPGGASRSAAAALLLGVLVATKVTFLILVPFVIAAEFITAQRGSNHVGRAFAFAACLTSGFALGAPYALLYPREYLDGIQYLIKQYDGGTWPHGLYEGAALERLQFSASYLLHAVGPVSLLLGGIGVVRLVVERRVKMVILVAGVGLTAIYFLQARVFFERNLSHVLPVLFVLAGLGAAEVLGRLASRRLIGAAAAGLLVVAVAWPPAQLTRKLVSEALAQPRTAEIRAADEDVKRHGEFLVDLGYRSWKLESRGAKVCGPLVFKLVDFGDRYTAAIIHAAIERGWVELHKRIEGPFHGMPTSTLHTYHAADLVYLRSIDRLGNECPLRFERMSAPDAADASVLSPELSGSAIRNGLPPGAPTPPWPHAVYSSWAGADRNLGEISFGPFLACRDVLFPLMHGPDTEGTALKVAQFIDSRWQMVYEGPAPAERDQWVLVRLRVGTVACRALWIVAYDRGAQWGQWIGIGEPIVERSPR